MILNNMGSAIGNLISVSQKLFRDYKYASKHRLVTCIYEDNGELYEFEGTKDPENKTVTPKHINQQFFITRGYRRFPQNDIAYICTKQCPETIDLSTKNIVLDDVRKGAILSTIAYDVFRTSIFKYMTHQNKREMILLIIVFSLVTFIIGIIIGNGLGASAGV